MTKEQERQQLHLFLKAFSVIEENLAEKVSERVIAQLEPRFQDLESKLDWIIDAIDTDEAERLALGATTDRQLDNHEHRITKLELAAS